MPSINKQLRKYSSNLFFLICLEFAFDCAVSYWHRLANSNWVMQKVLFWTQTLPLVLEKIMQRLCSVEARLVYNFILLLESNVVFLRWKLNSWDSTEHGKFFLSTIQCCVWEMGYERDILIVIKQSWCLVFLFQLEKFSHTFKLMFMSYAYMYIYCIHPYLGHYDINVKRFLYACCMVWGVS